MRGEFDFFIEWGVWSNLDSFTDYSLILLNGHIFLETVLEFEKWSKEVHLNFEGMKYTKFTARTRIVHSFSFLAKRILEAVNAN